MGRYARDRGSNPVNLVGAQPEGTGAGINWGGVRVKITRTGKQVPLALFEFNEGVRQGFINASFPGGPGG